MVEVNDRVLLVGIATLVLLVIAIIYIVYFRKSSGKKIVLFHRPDCGHCQRLKPEWERFERMSSDIDIQKININENPDIAQQYNVQGVPMIVLFKGSFRIDYTGNRTAEDILNFVNSN